MKYILSVFLLLLAASTYSQAPDASTILKNAQDEAQKSNKNVFVIFHASWCVWCHRMDTAMNEPKVRPLFQRNYVITHLTVDEGQGKSYLNNPGADEIRAKYHGDGTGIPFWFILDKNGNLLADSRLINDAGEPTDNVGCPGTEEELNYFGKVLQKTSDMNDEEIADVKAIFKKVTSH